MREIKFRGKTPAGERVYGDLTHYGGHTYIADKRVDPDTVAQLLGYDFNGDELYEGDEHIDAYGNKCTVIAVPAIMDNFTGEIKLTFSAFADVD